MYNDELAHHGIKGQKWGVRRFQNEDGSLTAAGEQRYGYNGGEYEKPSGSWHNGGEYEKSSVSKNATSASGSVSSSTRKTGKQKVNEFVHSKTGKAVITDALVVYGSRKVMGLIYGRQLHNQKW